MVLSTPALPTNEPVMPKRPAPFCPLSPELELLAACATTHLSEHRTQSIRQLLGQELDWQELLRLAEFHGLVPLLHHTLAGEFSPSVPPEGLDPLRRADEQNTKRSLWLTRELLEILGRLAAKGIPAIPFKGPALADTAYGNVALRQYWDLDIFIRPADWPHAKAALVEAGLAPEHDLCPAEERASLQSGYECAFGRPGARNLLEMQWAILPRFYAVDCNMADLFDRSRTAELSGREIRRLAPEDLLLLVAIHGAKHLWKRLGWICDVAQVVESLKIDWSAAFQRAQQWGVQRILCVSLELAGSVLGIELPGNVAREIRQDSEVATLAHDICRSWTEDSELDPESLRYFRLVSRLRERRSDRIRFFYRLATTPSVGEWSAVRLPSALFPLYRGVRLVRLLRRFARTPGRKN